MLSWLWLSSTEAWGTAQMSDPKDVSAEVIEGRSIAVDSMRLWKVVTVCRLL